MLMVIDLIKALGFPQDSGPIYKETIAGRFPVEPFNTFSNLIFLFIIIYFGIQVYKNIKNHLFLAWVLPVIGLSFVGGTIYHATRSHEIWLLLDWVPIMLLSLAAAIYFIYLWRDTWAQRILLVVIILTSFFGLRMLPLPIGLTISLGYLITALTILVPVLGYLYKSRWRNARYIIIAFSIFGLAVFFRILDKRLDIELFWMGTHWLWHFFGGLAVFFLIKYIFEDNKAQAINIS